MAPHHLQIHCIRHKRPCCLTHWLHEQMLTSWHIWQVNFRLHGLCYLWQCIALGRDIRDMLDSMFPTLKTSKFYSWPLLLGKQMLNQLSQYTKGAPIAAVWSVQVQGCSTQQNSLSYSGSNTKSESRKPFGWKRPFRSSSPALPGHS